MIYSIQVTCPVEVPKNQEEERQVQQEEVEDTEDEIWQVTYVPEEEFKSTRRLNQSQNSQSLWRWTDDTFFWLTCSDLLRIVVIFTSVSAALTLWPSDMRVLVLSRSSSWRLTCVLSVLFVNNNYFKLGGKVGWNSNQFLVGILYKRHTRIQELNSFSRVFSPLDSSE